MRKKFIPEAKVYDKKLYNAGSMKLYARWISNYWFEQVCCVENCKYSSPLQVHHRNKNRWDNRLENLVFVCCKHHQNIFHKLDEEKRVKKIIRSQSGMFGRKHSEETLKKMRRKKLLYWKGHPETRKSMAKLMVKRNASLPSGNIRWR